MERLTFRDETGMAFWVDKKCAGGGYRIVEDKDDQARLERLAEYEDTELEPEEIDEFLHKSYGPLHKKIGEWMTAEKEGRLVITPVEVDER